MTKRTDYTPEEWNVLGTAPLMIGMPVITAAEIETSQMTQEVAAMVQKIGESIDVASGNELVDDLMAQMRERMDAGERLTVAVDISNPTALKQGVLEMAGQVATILESKSNPDEAAGFKEWLMSIATKVAEAVKEGEVMSGTVNISPDEAAVMQEMRAALKLS